MTFTGAVKNVLTNYVTFTGRATRSEYWWWILATVLLFTVLAVIDGAVIAPMLGFESFAPEAGQPVSLLVSLALLLPNIAVAIRRLHDTDRSGWWLLLALIPLIGALVLIFFYVQPGTEGPNRFD